MRSLETLSAMMTKSHHGGHPGTLQIAIIVGALFVNCLRSAHAQKPPAEAAASLQAADGLQVKLFASEPTVVNPIALDVDTFGRVWVTEGTKYRRNVSDPPDDKIKVLEDTDGDGVADKMTVFTSDLNAAMSICVAGSKIYVAESPHVYVYEDQDNDLKPDGPRKILLTGFGGKNHDHGVHSLVFGPDHMLYMTNGDTGYDVTGPDGSHIKYRWGGMIRCEADGTQLEDFAVNFRNPVELAVDSFGNVWCSDNDNDGLKSVRICWILEGGNYGWFGGPENIRNPDGSFDPIHHWRADKPGFVPYVMITGFGSPCGMTFYENMFGSINQNKIIHCDAGPREVRVYDPQRLKGVGYTATLKNIVTSTDSYFRPVDPCVAPDGSIYVSDWYDGGVGGHAYNDPDRGRIYRITPAGKWMPFAHKPGPYRTDRDAIEALRSPNLATQFLARERLLRSGQKAVSALEQQPGGPDDPYFARGLWVCDRIGGEGRRWVLAHLKAGKAQALAVRILRRHGDQYLPEILKIAEDPDFAYRDGEFVKEILLAAAKSSSPEATAVILKAFQRYDGADRFLLETLGIAARGREQEIFAKVVDRPDARVTPRLIDIVRVLRPEDATRWLSEKLTAADLPPESASALLTALGAISSADAGRGVLGVLTGKSGNELKRLALESLRRNIGATWSALKQDPALKGALSEMLRQRELAAESLAVIGEAGLRELAPDVSGLLRDDSPAAVKLAAIDVASRWGLGDAGPTLVELLRSKEVSVGDAALKALVLLREVKPLATILSDPAEAAALKQRAADLLMGSTDGAIFLFRLVDTKRLEPSLAERVITSAVEHPDVNVRLLFEKHIPPERRPKTLGQSFTADEILALPGDAARGEAVFLRSGAASCSKCHRVRGKGSDIGPDLSQIGRKYERKALLETIMNPSAGVAPEYVPYVVETEQGKVYAGFLVDRNDERIVLKSVEGAVLQFERKDVADIVKQETSLMPELVLKSVTAQDAADLLAYLVGLQESMVHAATFRALGPFPNVRPEQRSHDFGPEQSAGTFDGAAQFEGIKGKKSWFTATAKPGASGIPAIDLHAIAAAQKTRAENVIYYFAATLDSASAQPATLFIGSNDGIQVWLNGRKVHDHKVVRSLTPAEDKVKVELNSGRNLLLLKLDQGVAEGGLTLSAEARGNLTFGVP